MFNKSLLLVVGVLMLAGCSSKSAEDKGFVRGCYAMAHDLLDPQGFEIDDVKLLAHCKDLSEKK